MPASAVRLLLVGDDPHASAAMIALLAAHPDCVVAGTASAGDDLAAAAAAARADAIVWDPGDDPETSFQLLPEAQDLGVPVIAVVADERDGARALAFGARGLVSRPPDGDVLAAAVRAAAAGLLAFEPAVAGFGRASRLNSGEGAEPLTPREREVLRLLAEGCDNKTLAAHLRITEHTAKFHVHTILGKLGARSRTEAVIRAVRLGLIAV